MQDAVMRLGTIGGPETFAGQSAGTMRKFFPQLSEPRYFSSGEALYAALADGEVDAIIGAAANLTGNTELADMICADGSNLYVVAEAQLSFGCHLLGLKGATLQTVRRVHGGPASIAQARAYLSAHLPHAQTVRYADPLATAAAVAVSDGGEAVLGTASLAGRFDLEILAEGIDGGAINGNWWAISTMRAFHPEPERLVVAGRWKSGGVGAAIGLLAEIGYKLDTVGARPTGEALFEADHLLRFSGRNRLEVVEATLAQLPGARLAGALRVPLPLQGGDGAAKTG